MPRSGLTLLPVGLVAASSLFLGSCLLPTKDDTVKSYPITSGRYYKAAELTLKSRDSVLFHIDITQSGTYLDTELSRPGCPTYLTEGTWHAFTSDDYPETQLRKRYKRAAGSSFNTACLTTDSLATLNDAGGEVFSLRNVTDTSFQTCDTSYEVCFGLCTETSANPDNGCHAYVGGVATDSNWVSWVK